MFSERQTKLLVAFAKHNIKHWPALSPYDLIPQWFKGEPPLRGFSRFEAPALSADLVAKCVALYDFSKIRKVYQHDIASVVAALLVWEALFPGRFGHLEQKVSDLLAGWDMAKEPISVELMDRWNDNRHPIRAAIFTMRCYDPYRIVTDRDCASDFLAAQGKK